LKLLKFGQLTLAAHGTKVLANASKHSAVSYQRDGEQIELLRQEVDQLLAKAEQADRAPLQDGLTIPAEITRRRERLSKLQAARTVIEERARHRAAQEQPVYASKQTDRAGRRARGELVRGHEPQPPSATPEPKDQYNFTDPPSRIMTAGTFQHFEQAYNAQAAVETDSRFIVAARVTDAPNDKEQLVPTLHAVAAPVRAQVVAVVEANAEPTVYAAVEKTGHHRRVADLEQRLEPLPPTAGAGPVEQMRYRLQTAAGRALYRLRQQTVEPVFGIIKEVLGFRRFLLRGLAGAESEWTLVCLAYNLPRLHRLSVAPA